MVFRNILNAYLTGDVLGTSIVAFWSLLSFPYDGKEQLGLQTVKLFMFSKLGYEGKMKR
jgi:hypothetical protein